MTSLRLNPARPIPKSNTGVWIKDTFANVSTYLLAKERRIDPFFRPVFDAIFQNLLARVATGMINMRRTKTRPAIAEETPLQDEAEYLKFITDSFTTQTKTLWGPGRFERGGNTKTHGIVRAEFIVHDGLPEKLRQGVFSEPRKYRAWIRFSGPGPYITPDIDDVGFMSISIKLLDVPGPKLLEAEKNTQDFIGISTPTFVTPGTHANAQLQQESLRNAQIFYFLNVHQPHLLDFVMQGLWLKTHSSPLEAAYFSSVPYLLGEGQAMQYSVWPRSEKRSKIPRLPFRPPDNYLRNNMAATLVNQDVEMEFRLQLQTDTFLMPIENNAVLWPERLSPRVPVATIRIPRQRFDSPKQMEFAQQLSYNPWHCIAEHRPLGNQNRARLTLYDTLSKLRHTMNGKPLYEPTGDERFE